MWRFAVLGLVACGASQHESARYDTELDAVMSVVTDVAKHNARQVDVDREHDAVHTAWQIVGTTQTLSGDPRDIAREMVATRYFARYDIRIVGPRPWQVIVAAHASRWVNGDVKPTELPDESPPAWLSENREHMIDDINRRLHSSEIAPR